MTRLDLYLTVTAWTIVHQAPLSMEFFRQEHWSGLPFPAPGDLPNPGTELKSLVSPAFFATVPPGKPSCSTDSLVVALGLSLVVPRDVGS